MNKLKNTRHFSLGDTVRQPDPPDGHVWHHPHHYRRPLHGGGGHTHVSTRMEVSVEQIVEFFVLIRGFVMTKL